MTFNPYSAHFAVATNEQHDFWKRSVPLGIIPFLNGVVEFYRVIPFDFERVSVSGLVPRVITVSVKISSHLSFDVVIMVSPRLSAHNAIPGPKVTPWVRPEVELESTRARSLVGIVQKEQVVEIAHRADALVLKEAKERRIFETNVRIPLVLGKQ